MSPEARQQLLAWYDANKRALPWRATKDPYAIWVSEVMLQQTQVATVLPYFRRWMERFPTIQSLAEANEQEVLATWQGLGYYKRCRMLHQGAKHVAQHGLPTDATGWMAVPGVGRYTAGAIASIAFNGTAPVVDGNVERVFARLTACEASGGKLSKAAWAWAHDEILETRPGDWNQALMELGACVCKPSTPACSQCPVSTACTAHKAAAQASFPRRPKRQETKRLAEILRIPYRSGQFGVRQIPSGQWWQGMWEFNRVEMQGSTLSVHEPAATYAGTVNYTVTNHRITMAVYLDHADGQEGFAWHTPEQLKHIPMPAPQRKALKLALKHLDEPTLFAHVNSSK